MQADVFRDFPFHYMWESKHGKVIASYCTANLAYTLQAGVPVKDVTLPDNPAKKTLLLSKHADYIEAFEKDKDDYVRMPATSCSH